MSLIRELIIIIPLPKSFELSVLLRAVIRQSRELLRLDCELLLQLGAGILPISDSSVLGHVIYNALIVDV